jgi:sugar-specific transcriptional regulator TrmB
MIQELLQKIGLSENEIGVYLCIVERGKLSAVDIARITKINRTTVYSVSKELIAKSLILEDLGHGSARYFSAIPPEELSRLYEKEEEILKEKKKAIEKAVEELKLLPKSKNYSIPKIRFVDEAQLEDFLYKQLATWNTSAKPGDPHWWGFQDATILEVFPEWIDFWWKNLPAHMEFNGLTNKKHPAEKKMSAQHTEGRRHMKYWDGSVEFTATHVVVGDYVLFLVTRQHPYYLVETHDPVMAENLRQMFKAIWKKID